MLKLLLLVTQNNILKVVYYKTATEKTNSGGPGYRTGRTARYLIGRVRRVGQVGRRDVLSDESDGWDRVEKIDYIYPPGACGMDHRMVVEIYYD